jgi:hypothetical protein
MVRNGVAGLFETGKIPRVRKIAALLWLQGLHSAVVAIEENALTIKLSFRFKPFRSRLRRVNC